MELFQLRSFHEVASSGSFSRAAENLCITQPALSRQIITLEKTVGMSLFNRHNRGVNLTDAGRRLYEYAEDVLKLLDGAQDT
ncbi:MAG: LysR family transcriptional regulator [Desulfitobacteriaceae bacterium]